jgi:HK97 family phage major capsid protein
MNEKLKALFAALEAASSKMNALEKVRDMRESKEFTAEELTAYEAVIEEQEKLNAKIDLEQRAEGVKASNGKPQTSAPPLEIHNVADEAKYGLGEFLQDVAFAARTQEKKPRLVMHQKRNLEAVRKEFHASTGMNEALPADGGFLVGTDFTPGLMMPVYENSVVASRCRRQPISAGSNGVKINGIDETTRATGSRFGGVQSYWIGEGATITSSKPKFRMIELSLKKDAVLYYATDELLQDAPALEANATTCVRGELDFSLQDALINGNGAGKPLGILNAPCLVTVDKETGQKADSIVFENISKMWARSLAAGRLNSIWLINQEIEPQLDLLAVPVGTGGIPAYMPPGGLADSPYGRLKGRPVIPVEQCAALGDAGDIILADFGEYILADKGGVSMASSMHVAFVTDELVFRFIYRVDGQPYRNSALTPFKGAGTLSSFVTLAARA